jgi:thermitase
VVLRRQVGVLLAALLGAIVLLVLSSSAKGQSPEQELVDEGPGGAPYAAGELIVTYKEDVSKEKKGKVQREAKAAVEDEVPEIDVQVLEFPELKDERSRSVRVDDLESKKREVERDPAVESVDYNYIGRAGYTPRDPKFRLQWGLRKTGFQKAWNRSRGGGVKVAVIDSGLDVRHMEFRRKVAARWDFRNNNRTVEDMTGHGTHVSGIVAARTGNGRGVAGGCPGCKILSAKVIGAEGWYYYDDLVDAIIWSANKGAKVINISASGSASSDALRRAVYYASRKGALVVSISGNHGTSARAVPGAYRPVIAVASTDKYDRRARTSAYGGWVDVAAPGVGILSSVPGGYGTYSGTSQAAPHVSAVAGLIAKKVQSRTVIRRRILRTAQDLGPAGRDRYYGHGRIRADRAVR